LNFAEELTSYFGTKFSLGELLRFPIFVGSITALGTARIEELRERLSAWLQGANARLHQRIGCRPTERIEADRHAMLELPPVAPSTGWSYQTRLPRDHYVHGPSAGTRR